MACDWLMLKNSGEDSNSSTRMRAWGESDTEIGLVVRLLTPTPRPEEKKPSNVGHKEDGNIEHWSDVGLIGVDDPRTQSLSRWPLERMISRDDGIRLMMLLLMLPANLEGNTLSDIGQNGDRRMEWSNSGRNIIVGPYLWCSAWGIHWTELKIGGRHILIQGMY